MHKKVFVILVLFLLNILTGFSSANSISSVRIINPKIAQAGDITWDSAIITFDLMVYGQNKEPRYLKVYFLSERPNFNFSIMLGEPIGQSEIGKKIEVRNLLHNNLYLVEFCLADKEGSTVAQLEEKFFFKTLRKPIEIKKWAAQWQEGGSILNLAIETDGIDQFCEPLKAIIRLGGMCPCHEEVLDDCTKQNGKNYCETVMDGDGEITAQFNIPEKYRDDIFGFFMIFEYKDLDTAEVQVQQTPIVQISFQE